MTTNDDREALATILAAPDDDRPRLLWADALERRGDPRGEFVRVQCALARGATGSIRAALRARERALLAEHEEAWLGPLAPLGRWTFRRGLLDGVEVRTDAADPAGCFRTIAEHAPTLTTLRFELFPDCHRAYGPEVLALAGSPLLARLTRLSLYDSYVGGEGVRAILVSPYAVRLVDLDLSSTVLHDEGVEALVRCERLARIERLSLRHDFLGVRGARLLAACPHLGRLRVLNLADNPIGDEGAAALAASPHLARLQELNLAGTDLGDDGVRAVMSRRAGLASLDLGSGGPYGNYNRFGGASVRALAAWPLLAGVSSLGLGGTYGDDVDDAAASLAGSPYVRGLRALDLADCDLGLGAARAIAASGSLGALESLALGGDCASLAAVVGSTRLPSLRAVRLTLAPGAALRDLGPVAQDPGLARIAELAIDGRREDSRADEGVAALAASPHVRGLRGLLLRGLELGDRGATVLARSENLSGLAALDLGWNAIGNAGAVALAEARWAALESLGLAVNRIGDAGARALAASPGLAGLDRFDLVANEPDDAARYETVAALQERFGRAYVYG